MTSKLDTRTILIIAASLSTLSVAKQKIIVQVCITAIALTLILFASDRSSLFKKIKGRMKHLVPALLSIAVLQIFFRRGGEVLFSFYFIKVTDLGVTYAIVIALRLVNLIFIAGLLFGIPSSDYMLSFKAWKFPYEISFLVTTLIRFIPDYYTLFAAYQETLYLRDIDLKKLSIKNKLNVLIALLIPVLVNNLNDVKYRAIALDLKGFRLYRERTSLYERKLTLFDYIVQITVLSALISVIIFV
ncbi:MAG: energy-coupling factor transporter transmembrane component T [Candidatus Cloacimonas sp.]|nr:energy-coupling factor transporter transmembrane protein EcfT [Candidatus Cloacimonadota bacterium]